MTEPLPTLAEIDEQLARSQETRTIALVEIAQHRAHIEGHEAEIGTLWCAVVELDEATDLMLDERSRIAALPVAT